MDNYVIVIDIGDVVTEHEDSGDMLHVRNTCDLAHEQETDKTIVVKTDCIMNVRRNSNNT